MQDNLLISTILDTDSYKLSHWVQYPPNTERMFSYFEARGGKSPYTIFFGLQYYLKRFLSKPITMEMVFEAEEFAKLHGVPFNFEGWKRIVQKFDGFLPVHIRAVPEGSKIPVSNILFSVESTDPQSFWVVSWLETLLVRMWYPITVATRSFGIKQDIMKYLVETSDDPESEIMFKLHDFGSRGSSSQESAAIGGAAHLVNFMGSDTIAGIHLANTYYYHKMAGFSIPASEHSTMTMWTKEKETQAYANMIKQYGDSPIFACVSDSYDLENAVSNIWGETLKTQVQDMKAVLVYRPDSGHPVNTPCQVIEAVAEKFGTVTNSKGYKVLTKDRVIQGDGIDREDVIAILEQLKQRGFSATNIAFGMGGGLLQRDMDRDTHQCAFKCSEATVNGKCTPVFKAPKGSVSKYSKQGKLDLEVTDNFQVKTKQIHEVKQSLMQTVFLNGRLLNETTFEKVRAQTKVAYI